MRRAHVFLALLICSTLSGAVAQTTADHLGRTPTKEELRKWESPILPDGSGHAVRGEAIFVTKCAGCHGTHGEGHDPVGPQLVGAIGNLGTQNLVLTVGSYWPYSTSVWDYIHRAMPYYPNPGTLSVDETYSVTAYILYLNQIIAKDEVMNQLTLPKVHMPNRNGFIVDPRPDVHAAVKR